MKTYIYNFLVFYKEAKKYRVEKKMASSTNSDVETDVCVQMNKIGLYLSP